ncbi:Succinate dehydrogenase assembly factor 2 mitochondrial [Thecaphora frezii]
MRSPAFLRPTLLRLSAPAPTWRLAPALPVPLSVSPSLRFNSSASSTTPSHPIPSTRLRFTQGGAVADAPLSDPYPLPLSPDVVDLNNANTGPESKWAGLNLASDRQNIDGVDAPMRVPGRTAEPRETKIARLVYQCRKRGTLETDLILSTFAKKELQKLPDDELDEFDRLLDEPDWDIFYWCTRRKPVPERWRASFDTEGKLGHRLLRHTKNEEKAVRWMPELAELRNNHK